ncbi:MAG: ribosome maturation factor RimP [Nitrospira sp.]|nr:ribosome maturation factor RimP [Nitrospira sp.]
MSWSTQEPADRARGREAQFIAERVRTIADPIARALGVHVVDVECVGQGQRTLVRVFLDTPGGVSLNECEQVHVSLGHALDIEDPIAHAYTLEVSSPGLDRPFKRREQYHRALGTPVNLKLRTPINGQWRVIGTLREVRDEGVTLAVEEKKTEQLVPLTWDQIAEGRPHVTF